MCVTVFTVQFADLPSLVTVEFLCGHIKFYTLLRMAVVSFDMVALVMEKQDIGLPLPCTVGLVPLLLLAVLQQ